MKVEELKQLKSGDRVLVFRYNKPYVLKINGKPKTWKTRPDNVQIPYKYGLYEYGYIGNTIESNVDTDEIRPYESPIRIEIDNTTCPICNKKHHYAWYYQDAKTTIPYCQK